MREQRAHSPEQVLADFVRHELADAVLVLDRDGSLVERNRAAGSERFASAVSRFEHAQEDPELAAFLRELEANGRATRELPATSGPRASGPLALEGHTSDAWFVVTLRDLTERRALEDEIKELRHFEALGLLTANVLHDFNNLMTPMLVLSSTLASELDTSSSAAAIAADLESIATRSALLFRNVVATTRPHERALEAIGLNAVLRAVRPWLERVAGSRVAVTLALGEPQAQLLVDRPGLEHAILNLVANARNAMPDGGTLRISTSVEIAPAELANGARAGTSVKHEAPRAEAVLRVTDDGAGMTDEVRARAFEAFFTTREEEGGTGLGLASVKRFVTASGGSVKLESAPGRGTTVTLRFPQVRDAAPKPHADRPLRH
ncbi:MAG TPA: ATP-binding protein [Polyangiaceae bacterium]